MQIVVTDMKCGQELASSAVFQSSIKTDWWCRRGNSNMEEPGLTLQNKFLTSCQVLKHYYASEMKGFVLAENFSRKAID